MVVLLNICLVHIAAESMRSSVLFLFSSLLVGDSYRTDVHEDTILDADVDEQWGFSCPHGLEANATAETCTYHGEMMEDPDKNSTEKWAGGSHRPLVFKSWGGLAHAESELISELQFTLSQPEFVSQVVRSSMAHHGHTESTYSFHRVHEAVEAHSEDLAAVEFVAEHAVEHLVLESLAVGLASLSHAALHGGLGFTSVALEGTVVGLEVLGAVLGHPIVIGYQAVNTALQLRHHFHTKDARSSAFTVGLVSKADCIASKVTLHHEGLLDEQNDLRDSNFFVPEFEEVCGKDTEILLAEQMVKTNSALLDLFHEFKGIGKCLFPEGPRAWSKSNCVHAIYEPLRSYEGEPGILYSAFALAAAYGQETDELLTKPIYSAWFERYFNITLPHARDVREDLVRLRDTHSSTAQEKATTCVSVLGVHRAFERVFVRLKTALQIFMHTFARSNLHVSTRTTQYPCRRVFREFEERDQGLCKDGTDLPLVVPDTEWLEEHAQHLTDSMLYNVGECLEDTHPELASLLTLSSSGPEEGENEEEEESEGRDEE